MLIILAEVLCLMAQSLFQVLHDFATGIRIKPVVAEYRLRMIPVPSDKSTIKHPPTAEGGPL
jgi:hypothetical protein